MTRSDVPPAEEKQLKRRSNFRCPNCGGYPIGPNRCENPCPDSPAPPDCEGVEEDERCPTCKSDDPAKHLGGFSIADECPDPFHTPSSEDRGYEDE